MITPEEKKKRSFSIGGSDTAVYGLNFFKSPYELWEEKAGIREDAFITNDAVEFGNESEETMSKCIENIYVDYEYSPKGKNKGVHRGNADGLSKDKVIEFKTSKASNKSRYGNVPIAYWLQVQRYMDIFTKKKADLWFYFATPKQIKEKDTSKIKIEKMIKHEITFSEEAIKIMDEMALYFWECVEEKKPPINYLIKFEKEIKKIKEIYNMSILEQLGVKNLADNYRPYKSIIVYGRSGSGKTTFATRDGKSLVLDINEQGAGVALSGNVIEVKNLEHLENIVKNLPALKKELGFNVLVIETLGKLRDIVLATVMARNGRKKAQIQDYGETATLIKEMISFIIDMMQAGKFHLVITGHEAINGNTNVDGATINPSISIDSQDAVKSAVTTSVDIIARAKVSEEIDENNNAIIKHIIDVTPSTLFVTKTRTKNNIILETTELENCGVKKLVRLVETGKEDKK